MSPPSPHTPAPVQITLTGALRIRTPTHAIEGSQLGGRRAQVAFARLALDAGRTVSRDVLAEAVWGERLPATWRPALRNLITAIRSLLASPALGEAAVLQSVDSGYRLELATGSSVDVVALESAAAGAEEAARAGDHARVLEIADAARTVASLPALADLDGDWVAVFRDSVTDLRERLARACCESAVALGEPAQAERFARELVAFAPLREDGYRLLMGALYAAGNRGEALAVHERCRRLLLDQLAIAPSAATEALFLEILGDEPATPGRSEALRPHTPAGIPAVLGRRRNTPFVGRDAVLALLTDRLDAARRAGPCIVTVRGEPGIGKTRLAAELAQRVGDGGAAVLYGRADDRVALPTGPFLEAIAPELARLDPREAAAALGRHAGVLGRLLPGLPTPAAQPTGIPDLDQLHVAQAIEHALALAAAARGALLVLDDMQWATRADVAVLEVIANAATSLPVLVLVLHRIDEDAGGLASLANHPRLERLALEPLMVEDIAELARGRETPQAGDTPLHEFAAGVWERSGGNPLFANEVLRSVQEGADEHPRRIAELIRERVARLPLGSDDVLKAAAVAGLEFDPHAAGAASMVEPKRVLEALAAARESGLLVPASHDPHRLAFGHALVRTTLLETLDETTKLRLHERLGSVLESQPRLDATAPATLAYHFGAAAPLGDWRRAVGYGLPVARTAFDAGIFEDTMAISARTINALLAAGDPDPGARLDLEILLGGAQRALGDDQGHQTLRDAFASARDLGDVERMADAALAFSADGAASDEAYIDDSLVEVYAEAVAALGGGEPRRRARLLGRLASAYAWRQSREASERAARDALELARETGDGATLSRVQTNARRSLSGSVRVREQDAAERELLALADELDDPGLRARAALWRFETRVEQGRDDGLEALIDLAAANTGQLRMGSYHHSLAYAQAALALLRGNADEADLLVARAAAIGRQFGIAPMIVEAIRMMQLMGVRHEQGRLAELREELASFFASAGMPVWLGAVAFIDAGTGRTGSVAANLDAFFDGFSGTATMVTPIGFAAHMATPIAAVGDTRRASLLYDAIVPHAGAGAYFAFFAGPIDYALGLLACTLGRNAAAECHLADARAFCERLGAPLWTARCDAALAGHGLELVG
jgi:DNA-binding SARP family transcriptional activator